MERVTLRLAFKVVAWKTIRSWSGANVNGKKKKDEEAKKKQRDRLRERWVFVA
jgi:hypothetical protein